jgi:hypothetical protein
MKLFKAHRKLSVTSLALVVAIFAGGAAYAYFSTTGGGTGNAYTGTGASVSITQLTPNSQVVYDSFVNPMPSSTPSEAFSQLAVDMNGPASVGNAVTLASAGKTLSSAVVALNNWACQVGNGNYLPCTTTVPGSTYPATMTFNVYDPSVSLTSPVATDTQTFAIPYRPSADAAHCGATSPEWYDAASSTCHSGQTTTVTFNSFTGSNLVLPSNVVYEISYTPTSNLLTDPSNYLNFSLSTESTNVSIGSDTNPGNLYMNIPSATAAAGPSGQVTCQAQATGFVQYSTAAGTNCGLGTTLNIPVVEINAGAGGYISLVPGGPAQPVDFSIYNGGSNPAYVQSVSFALTSSNVALCDLNWFSLVQPTIPVNVSIPAGATVNYQPSGAFISLMNEPYNQNACENATLNLTFSAH